MFTGIVQDTGVITSIISGGDATVEIKPSAIDPTSMKTGESVSVDGVCLTVVSVGKDAFFIQVSRETFSRTKMLEAKPGKVVNLERSVTPDGLVGGHIVTGHIDGVGAVESTVTKGESIEFNFLLPDGFMKYVAPKGCITLDGVSLTVNEAGENGFSVNIIPHTLSHTTFSSLSVGDKVNFECDIVAKYIERLIDFDSGKTS